MTSQTNPEYPPPSLLEVIILIGLQASGKSTFYQKHFCTTHALISRDLLRNNKRPARRQLVLLHEALVAGRSVVVDNTNPTIADREPIIEVARQYQARVKAYYFRSVVADCIVNNQQRTGKQQVPPVALYSTIKILQPPSPNENFDEIYYVRWSDAGHFDICEWKEDLDE